MLRFPVYGNCGMVHADAGRRGLEAKGGGTGTEDYMGGYSGCGGGILYS